MNLYIKNGNKWNIYNLNDDVATIPPSSPVSIPFMPQDYRYDAMNYFLTRSKV
jgi:hypothetical protein